MSLPKSLTTVTPLSKILAGVLFILLPFLGFYLGMGYQKAISPRIIESPTPIVRTTPKPITDLTSDWKTYKFEKLYSRTKISFEIKYPSSFGKPQQKGEEIKWVDKNSNKINLSISWLNPDLIYDVESICSAKWCNKIDEAVSNDQQYIIPILKPTRARQIDLKLSNDYLYADIFNAEEGYSLTFSTDILTISDFKKILSTFKFTTEEKSSL